MEDVMIKMNNATVAFKGFCLEPINLEIPKGYIIGVQGENGAGKSTLLKMILGTYKNMKGSISVDGFDVINDREQVLSRVGVVEEQRAFFEEEDARKNEEYYSAFYDNWDKEMYRNMLKRMGISCGKKIGSLSKGERVKFQLAFAAAYCPKVLILDEPTAGLDPVFREDFLRILQEFVAEFETTVIMSTHIKEDLSKIADYMIEIHDGECAMKEVV